MILMTSKENTVLFENNDYEVTIGIMDSPWNEDGSTHCYVVKHKQTNVVNHKTTLYPEALLWCNELQKDVKRYMDEGMAEDILSESSQTFLQ